MQLYHERQLGGLCGVHCLNNLLQGPYFGPGDLAEIGVRLDEQEKFLFLSQGAEGLDDATHVHQPYNVDSSADGGNFSIQVLTMALKRYRLELLPAKHPTACDLMDDPTKAAKAFLLEYRDHWFAVREVAECWWNLDSTRDAPTLVSPFYMSAWFGQLSEEGHSIFLVLGAELPTRSPHEDGRRDENLHDVFDLLGSEGQPKQRSDALAIQDQQPKMGTNTDGLVSTLRDMGFTDMQIRIAEVLSRTSMHEATELLVTNNVMAIERHDVVQVSEAIQRAITNLDRLDVGKVAVMEFVTLLHSKDARLNGLNFELLAEYLLTVLAKWEEKWPPEIVTAISVAMGPLVSGETLVSL